MKNSALQDASNLQILLNLGFMIGSKAVHDWLPDVWPALSKVLAGICAVGHNAFMNRVCGLKAVSPELPELQQSLTSERRHSGLARV